MSTFRPKFLGDGELPTAAAALVTFTADIGTYLKSFFMFNKNAATQTILISVLRANGSGIARLLRRIELEQFESAQLVDDDTQSIRFEAGDQLLAETTTANAVDYDIDGVTEVN